MTLMSHNCLLGCFDSQLCRDFLGALAVCFRLSFSRALAGREQQPEAVVADTASLTTRHAAVAVCSLYDFGFLSPKLFVELIHRVAGLQDGSQTATQRIKLSDFRVELLLLVLRLGGGKLRQDDGRLFTATWKQLQGLAEVQQSEAEPRSGKGSSNNAGGSSSEAGGERIGLAWLLQGDPWGFNSHPGSIWLVLLQCFALRPSSSAFSGAARSESRQAEGEANVRQGITGCYEVRNR